MLSFLNKTTSDLRKVTANSHFVGMKPEKQSAAFPKPAREKTHKSKYKKNSSEKQHYSPLYFAGLCVPFHNVFVIWTAIQAAALLMPSHTVYSTVMTTILQKITEGQLTGVVLTTESSPHQLCEQGAFEI